MEAGQGGQLVPDCSVSLRTGDPSPLLSRNASRTGFRMTLLWACMEAGPGGLEFAFHGRILLRPAPLPHIAISPLSSLRIRLSQLTDGGEEGSACYFLTLTIRQPKTIIRIFPYLG